MRWLELKAQGSAGLFEDSLLKCKYSKDYSNSNQLLVNGFVGMRLLISRVLLGIVIKIDT